MHRRPRTAVEGCSEFSDLKRLRPYRLRTTNCQSDPNTHCSIRTEIRLVIAGRPVFLPKWLNPSYFSKRNLSTQIYGVLERVVLISDLYCSDEWATSTVLRGLSCRLLASWIHTKATSSGRARWGGRYQIMACTP